MKFNNGLSDSELERLAILSEEMGEAIQVIGKIIRHGYESKHPSCNEGPDNRQSLEKELGDVLAIMEIMKERKDIDTLDIEHHITLKRMNIIPYLHHQEEMNVSNYS